MELPGELATRGAYGLTAPKKDEELEEHEEDEDEKEEVFYIRNALARGRFSCGRTECCVEVWMKMRRGRPTW